MDVGIIIAALLLLLSILVGGRVLRVVQRDPDVDMRHAYLWILVSVASTVTAVLFVVIGVLG